MGAEKKSGTQGKAELPEEVQIDDSKQIQEEVDNDLDKSIAVIETPKLRDGEMIVSSIEFWDFEKHPVFIGSYDRVYESEKLNDDGEPKVRAYVFNDEFWHEWLIGQNYQINKALNFTSESIVESPMKSKCLLQLHFKGHQKLGDGRNFSKFDVSIV